MSGFTSGMKSSLSDEWTTPHDLFDELDAEFGFDLDVASTDANALCERHYTAEDDGLAQPWAGSVWCNPPYGRQIGRWLRKAAESNRGGGHCLPRTREDGHGMVARLGHGTFHGGQVHTRQAQVRGRGKRSAVSERDRHIRQATEEMVGGEMTDGLKTCPFCGGEALMGVNKESTVREYFVGCMNCHIRLYKIGYKRFYTEAEAIAAWNTRAERTCEVWRDGKMARCSECRYEHHYETGWKRWRYCPNCGAKVVDA